MSFVRKFAVVVLTLLLTSTLLTGNLLAAAHLTVLDPTFVQNTVEEEGGYELVENATVEVANSRVQGVSTGGATNISELVDTKALLRDAINRSYLERQTERNVNRTYAFLHGENETLNITVNTAPLKDDIEAAVEAQVRNASIAELLEQTDADLTSLTGSNLPIAFNQTTVERMTANESGYEAVKEDVRRQIRERVLDQAVEQAWQETSNDQKLALIIPDYDPRDYTEAEKEQMVADNETEIRAALRERIKQERGDEIDQQVNATLAQANETLAPNTTDAEGIDGAVLQIQAAFVEGLTTNMTYEEFQSDLDAAKADAAVAIGNRTGAALDEQLPDQLSLTSEMDPAAKQSLQQAQTAVTWLDRLAYVIPVLALVLIGLVYLVTRSLQTVASSAGFSLVFAGLPIYLSLGFLQSTIERRIEQQVLAGDPNELVQAGVELLLGVLGQLFGRIGAVSLAFAVAGIVLLAVWLALRYDVLDRGGSGGEPTGASGDEPPAADTGGGGEPAEGDESGTEGGETAPDDTGGADALSDAADNE